MDYVLLEPMDTALLQTIYLSSNETEFQFSGDRQQLLWRIRIDGSTFIASSIGGTETACDTELMTEDDWLVSFFSGSPSFEFSGSNLSFERRGHLGLWRSRRGIPDAALKKPSGSRQRH